MESVCHTGLWPSKKKGNNELAAIVCYSFKMAEIEQIVDLISRLGTVRMLPGYLKLSYFCIKRKHENNCGLLGQYL